jgi:hypothetical protein
MEIEHSQQEIPTDAQTALALQEQIEILQEMVENQNRYLDYLQQQLLVLTQELTDANQQMEYFNQEIQDMYSQGCAALNSKNLTLDGAKEIAKTILASEKSTIDSLALLLSEIYGSPVESWELEQRQTPSPIELNPTIRNDIDGFDASEKLRLQCTKLGIRFVALKARFNKLKAQHQEQMNRTISRHPRAKSRFGAGVSVIIPLLILETF